MRELLIQILIISIIPDNVLYCANLPLGTHGHRVPCQRLWPSCVRLLETSTLRGDRPKNKYGSHRYVWNQVFSRPRLVALFSCCGLAALDNLVVLTMRKIRKVNFTAPERPNRR